MSRRCCTSDVQWTPDIGVADHQRIWNTRAAELGTDCIVAQRHIAAHDHLSDRHSQPAGRHRVHIDDRGRYRLHARIRVVFTGLPAGLTIASSTGVIFRNTNCLRGVQPKSQITDSIGSTTRTYPMTVGVVTLAVSAPATLPGGEVAIAYTSTLTAVGGTTPHTRGRCSAERCPQV